MTRLDGLLLAGGADIDPRLYGSTPGPGHGTFEPGRDRFELALIEAALTTKTPILGICRGIQILNVALGGTLVADLPADSGQAHSSIAYPRENRSHRVTIDNKSLAAEIYGSEVWVNSYHHQAVERVASGLTVSGQADDNVIEVVEDRERSIFAVQWHPEMLSEMDPCFVWFVSQTTPMPSE